MKLSRKIQKLVTAEALESLVEHARRWTHPVAVKPMLDRLDGEAWRELKGRFPHRPDAPKINRFADIDQWLPVNVERAQDLWLDRTPSLRLLDLGCGAGYFLYVSSQLGHSAIGMDVDEQPLFRETTALLGVKRIIKRIEAFTPLPDLGEKFDFITAHRVCFHQRNFQADGSYEEWDPPEWDFFLDDVRSHLLKPDGRLLLDFNPQPDGTVIPPAIRVALIRNGARIFRSKALFAADPGRVPVFKLVS